MAEETKTEHEGTKLKLWIRDHREPRWLSAQPEHVIAALSANPELRAAVLGQMPGHTELNDLRIKVGNQRRVLSGQAVQLEELKAELATERARAEAAEAMVEDATELALWLKSLDWYQPHSVVARRDRILASRPAEQAKDPASPQHTCVLTQTTADGSVPAPCKACALPVA